MNANTQPKDKQKDQVKAPVEPDMGLNSEWEATLEQERRSDAFLNEALAAKCGAAAFSI